MDSMTKTRARRSKEERRAIVASIDLRIQSGSMTHREATRLEGISDALVHSWRRSLKDQTTDAAQARPTVTGAASRRTAKAKAPNPTFEFLLAFMKKRPKAIYADAAAAATAAGHTIFPIMWGRAQALLGRVKIKPRGAPKTTASPATKAERPDPVARVGRPRKLAVTGGPVRVADEDLHRVSALVSALHSGKKAVLRFDGQGWELDAE